MASFTFLYTNNDADTTVISARIPRKAPQNGTLYIFLEFTAFC
jgi:hypothetical protein